MFRSWTNLPHKAVTITLHPCRTRCIQLRRSQTDKRRNNTHMHTVKKKQKWAALCPRDRHTTKMILFSAVGRTQTTGSRTGPRHFHPTGQPRGLVTYDVVRQVRCFPSPQNGHRRSSILATCSKDWHKHWRKFLLSMCFKCPSSVHLQGGTTCPSNFVSVIPRKETKNPCVVAHC